MNKKIGIGLVIILVAAGLATYYFKLNSQKEPLKQVSEIPKKQIIFSPQNCSYKIENNLITLVNGSMTEITPGTEEKNITSYFGNAISGDFNNDGFIDSAFILTQSTGGTGTFYYLTIALNTNNGCQGTNSILLGDRISPKSTEFINGEIIVNYADRKIDEPMATEASVGISKYFKFQNGILLEMQRGDSTQNNIYSNNDYGFQINLPESWRGYSVLTEKWQGKLLTPAETKYEGPKILIRHPKWTQENPWQDIPVMIFTPAEWELVAAENLGVSAAPIPPSKLGSNSKYVFALPPRWIGFTDNLNQVETAEIIKSFKAF